VEASSSYVCIFRSSVLALPLHLTAFTEGNLAEAISESVIKLESQLLSGGCPALCPTLTRPLSYPPYPSTLPISTHQPSHSSFLLFPFLPPRPSLRRFISAPSFHFLFPTP
jgi:hypothetical protein